MTSKSWILGGLVALCALPVASRAQTAFLSENFDSVPLTPPPPPLFSGTIGPFTAANVQVVSACPAPASGHCVVLQNLTGSLMSGPLTLKPGIYSLSFDLVGNGIAGGDSTTKVTLGSLFDQTFNLANGGSFGSRMVTSEFTVPATETVDLSFGPVPGNISRTAGMLVDNVELVNVPEPATLLLFGGGLLLLGMTRRRQPQA